MLRATEMIWFLKEGRGTSETPPLNLAFHTSVDVGSGEVWSAALCSPALLMTERDYQEMTSFSMTDHDILAFLGTAAD